MALINPYLNFNGNTEEALYPPEQLHYWFVLKFEGRRVLT
jgi:hypothetical protein